jgi:hypothetical protein
MADAFISYSRKDKGFVHRLDEALKSHKREAPAGSFSPPFNPGFLADLAKRRGARVKAFDAYRRTCDPNGVFRNNFVLEKELLSGLITCGLRRVGSQGSEVRKTSIVFSESVYAP